MSFNSDRVEGSERERNGREGKGGEGSEGREEAGVEGRQHHSPRLQWVSTLCTELPLPPAYSPSPRSPLSRGSQRLGSRSSVSKGT